MILRIHRFDLKIEHTFATFHEARDIQPSLVIQLGEGEVYGLGESVATAYYGYSIETMIAEVESKRDAIESYTSFSTPELFYASLLEWFPNNSFVRCAFDMAAHDLYGKLQKTPLYQLWNLDISHIPPSNYTIGIASIDKMKEKMIQKPWPIYKIKLGTEYDIDIVKELRSITDAVFRVDANCGWTADETIENSRILKSLGVEFIEQPLPASQLEEMTAVKKYSVLPLIADENCMLYEDVEKCYGKFHGINIKLPKCGGLTPALKMVDKAETLGLKKMVGCMTESSVGISAIAHMLSLLDYVDMDGAILLAEDPAEGVWLDDKGYAHFAKRDGTGALLKASTN